MNCKPGDLAYVKNGWPEKDIGCVIRVTQLDPRASAVFRFPIWAFEGSLPSGVKAIADDCLRPIGNPGEDAQDETLAWKPLPLPTLETV